MPLFRTLPGWKKAAFSATQRHPAVSVAAFALLLSGCAPLPQASHSNDDASATTAARTAAARSTGDTNSRWQRWSQQRRADTEALAKAAPAAPKLSDKPDPFVQAQEGDTEFVPDRSSDQRGVASWYGPGFHGRLTANGERFNQGAMTAAHPTLAFGTHVCVRSAINGKTVVVRINDRGPFSKNRVIDLSKAAAEELGMMGLGVKRVELWALEKGETDCPGEDVTVARAPAEDAQGGSKAAAQAGASRNALHDDALRALEQYRQQQVTTARNQ